MSAWECFKFDDLDHLVTCLFSLLIIPRSRTDRLLESKGLKKTPASFKISNDDREVIDLLYHG